MSEFIEAMRQLAAGVAVVTVNDERDDVGATVTAFMSVSAAPPMVLISLNTQSYVCELLQKKQRWAATLLGAGQAAIASRFASPGRPSARLLLGDLPHHRGEQSRALIIDGGAAAVECATEQRIEAGDHMLFVARVLGVDYVEPSTDPLVRLRGRYRPAEPYRI